MKQTIHFTANTSMTAKASRQLLNNEEHLVVPVIAIKEGVLNNMLYTSEELQQFTEAWNGVPVPVDHPKKAGKFISANSTNVEEESNIGRLYNVNFDETKKAVKGEIWINIDKAISIGHGDIVERLEDGEMLEVSTGLFSNSTAEAGEFNGKTYEFKANGIRPDHLALLPNTVGACSIEDGCGAMRVNCNGDENCTCAPVEKPAGFWNGFKKLIGIKANEKSYQQVQELLYRAVRGQLIADGSSDTYPHLVQVFSDNFIYEVGHTLYKRSYSIDDMNKVALADDSQEVILKTEYVPADTSITTNNNMDKNIIALGVAAFVANCNDGVALTPEEQAKVEGLGEDILGKLATNKKTEATPVVPVVNKNTDTLSPDDRALLDRFKANETNRLAGLRSTVVENYTHLTEEVVANMDDAAVETLATSLPAAVVANRIAQPGSAPAVKDDDTHQPLDIFANLDETK